MEHLGKYKLEHRLAIGGMAEVFLAKSVGPMGFEKILVVKRILPHLAEDPKFVEMFLSEAKLAARLNHPNVVQIYDFGEDNGSFFLAMEHVDGPTLRAICRGSDERRQPLPLSFCVKVVSQVCEGLGYAHDFADPETGRWLGIVHRDISPENILLSRAGIVKVVDFGIAKAAAISQTKSHSLRGKFAYLAPEQLRRKTIDRRTDVYALGVVLYELIAGARPFDAGGDVATMRAILSERSQPPSKHRPDVPPELDEICQRALGPRSERYATCHELQAALEGFLVSHGGSMSAMQIGKLVGDLEPGPPRKGSSGAQPRPEALFTVTSPSIRIDEEVLEGAGAISGTAMSPAIPAGETVIHAAMGSAEVNLPGTRSISRRVPVWGWGQLRRLVPAGAAIGLLGALAIIVRAPTDPPPPKPHAPLSEPVPFPTITPRRDTAPIPEPARAPLLFQVPRGTTVILDGLVLGVAPLAATETTEGIHVVRLERKGAEPLTLELEVEAGRTNTFRHP